MQGKLSVTVFLLSCIVWHAQGAVNCTSTGRFPDPDDTTCKNYSLCVLNTDNSFISYDYTCPKTSFFDPVTNLCTTNYVCNTTTTTNTTTDTVCTADGFVANPNSTDCSTYIQCVQINGTFDQTVLTCPNNTYYNPNTTLCEVDYNCTQTQTQAPATCTSAGRIPDTTDSTCQAYFLCVATTNGTLIEYSYTCPSTSVFSPTSRVCTTDYTCPT